MAFRTASLWPSTLTRGNAARTIPFASMTKVVRSTPIDLRPYMFFSFQTPYASQTRCSASASKMNGRLNFWTNRACELDESGLTPRILGASGLIAGEVVPERAGLLRAAGRIVLRIEVQDDRRSAKCGEGRRDSRLVGKCKVGCFLPTSTIFHLSSIRDLGGIRKLCQPIRQSLYAGMATTRKLVTTAGSRLRYREPELPGAARIRGCRPLSPSGRAGHQESHSRTITRSQPWDVRDLRTHGRPGTPGGRA